MTRLSLNIHDAKTHLSRYLREVEAGARVTLCRNGDPVAEIIPIRKKSTGIAWGRGRDIFPDPMSQAFFEALTDGDFAGIGLPDTKRAAKTPEA